MPPARPKLTGQEFTCGTVELREVCADAGLEDDGFNTKEADGSHAPGGSEDALPPRPAMPKKKQSRHNCAEQHHRDVERTGKIEEGGHYDQGREPAENL
jgi:hypothetical protein